MFGAYIKERTGKEILETEYGFASYYYINDCCYVEDMYIKPEYRKTGQGSKFFDDIGKIAKEFGYKKLYCTVVPTTNGSTESLKFVLSCGFQLDTSANNFIVFSRNLEK